MKRYIVRLVLIAKLAALALTVLCFQQAQVHAQGMAGYIVIFPSVGLAHDQFARFTLYNPDGAPLRAQAQIRHPGGMLVGLGDGSVRFVQAGVFHSFDLKRSDISLPGETGTGRIQISALISYTRPTIPEAINPVVASMEIVEIKDGTSNTIIIGEVSPSAPNSDGGRDVLIGGDARDILMAFVRRKTVRATIFNPPSYGSEAQSNTVSGHVKVFDSNGGLITQSDVLVIPPGEFRSFDFNCDALSFPGGPGVNRMQARIKPFFEFKSERLTRVLASYEIVDNSTGNTEALIGQQCLVFYLGGIPGN